MLNVESSQFLGSRLHVITLSVLCSSSETLSSWCVSMEMFNNSIDVDNAMYVGFTLLSLYRVHQAIITKIMDSGCGIHIAFSECRATISLLFGFFPCFCCGAASLCQTARLTTVTWKMSMCKMLGLGSSTCWIDLWREQSGRHSYWRFFLCQFSNEFGCSSFQPL